MRKYLLFTGKLDFFTEATYFTEAVASFASYHRPNIATTLPVNSVSVTTLPKNYVYTFGIWGAKSFFFVIWGLSPP